MNTKTLLIIFACLLVLLALLSAFGGSIRTQQPFEGFYSPGSGVVAWDGGVTPEERFPMPPPMPPMPPTMPQGDGGNQVPSNPVVNVADASETFIEPFENLETPSFGPY
jgi:hypothetical protein